MPQAPTTPFTSFYHAPSPSRVSASPYPPGAVQGARRFAHGAASALLVFSGASALSGGANAASGTPAAIDFTSLEGSLQTLTNSEFAGPGQIILAALVFLAAGQCVARFAGLAIAGLVIFLYLQGVTLADVGTFLEHFVQRLGAAGDAFQAADVT